MRLRTRLVLLIAIAALGPLAMLGIGATSISTVVVRDKVTDLQGRTADGLALYVDTWVKLQLRLLGQQTRVFRLDTLDDHGLLQFLRLVYLAVPESNIVGLTDARGIDRVPGVYRPADGGEEALALVGREPIDRDRLTRFRAALPPQTGDAEFWLGRPWTPEGRGAPVLPLVIAAGADSRLAVELALDPVAEELARQGNATRDVVLLDAQGEPVIRGSGGLVDPDAFRLLPGGAAASDVRYRAPDGREALASSAPVRGAGWTIVVAEPLESTTAAAGRIRARTLYLGAVAGLLSLVLGVLFSRQISRPVVELRDAALAVAEGDLGRRVSPPSSGELAELTRAFNFMSGRLERNRREIDAKNREIESFNAELQARVDARTRELSEAQERLLHSARLAAAGEMGAGLAHELNNPLAGILGLAQVLLAKAADAGQRAMLGAIEEQGLRCKEIVAHLLRLTSAPEPGAALDSNTRDVVDLTELLDEVLALVGGQLRQRGLSVERQGLSGLIVRGDRSALAQALAQLLGSLRMAGHGGGVLQVTGSRSPGAVELRFSLIAAEVRVGKDDWMATGMGIWAARQVLAAHNGTLVEPPPGATSSAGSPVTWRLILPEA